MNNTQLSKLSLRLQDIANLKDNWDNNGASAPTEFASRGASEFLLFCFGNNYTNNLLVDNIAPTTYGTIVFDWYRGDNLLSVEIGDSEIGFFSKINGEYGPESDGEQFTPPYIVPKNLVEAFSLVVGQ